VGSPLSVSRHRSVSHGGVLPAAFGAAAGRLDDFATAIRLLRHGEVNALFEDHMLGTQ
jgi:hypothetical protein